MVRGKQGHKRRTRGREKEKKKDVRHGKKESNGIGEG